MLGDTDSPQTVGSVSMTRGNQPSRSLLHQLFQELPWLILSEPASRKPREAALTGVGCAVPVKLSEEDVVAVPIRIG